MPTADSPVRVQQLGKGALPDRRAWPFFNFACLVLALFAVARMCYVVATTGADCITNDDILFVALTENMFSGNYDWTRYFPDTFINGHCCAAIQALLLILGPAASWNQYTLCFAGILMAALRAHFTSRFLCIAAGQRLYFPTLAIVSWMIFSFSQVSIFTTGIFSLMWQSCLLFMIMGAYLIWRYPDRLSAAFTAAGLGILASWSLAVALPSWLVYLLIAIMRGARNRVRRVVPILLGAMIGFTPYFFFVLPGAEHSRKFGEQFVNWVDQMLFVNSLGRCFANDIGNKFGALPGSELAGAVGLASVAVLAAAMIGSFRLRRLLAPCLILSLWSMITLAMILVVRSGVAPWYALIAAWFWSGLTSASMFITVDCANNPGSKLKTIALLPLCLVLPAVALWTWQYNKTYLDKQYYLENRTPVSASIMRNYDIAPEVFASYVFKLPGLSVPVTAKMLERNHWSVFSRNQTWEMQGDAIFPLAQGYRKGVDFSACTWIRGTNQRSAVDFRSSKHLNLCVPPKSVATWRVSIPRAAQNVVLKTAVALEKRDGSMHSAGAWVLATKVEKAPPQPVCLSGSAGNEFQSVSFDLSAYRGRDVSLLFSNSSAANAIVFQYPVINCRLNDQ